MLNLGKNALEALHPWPWLETTTTGTGTVTISDLRQILYVVDTTNKVILPGLDIRSTVEFDPELQSGTASSWWLDGLTTLKVHPTNATVGLSVRYIKWTAELSAGADTPSIPARDHPVWIDFAVVEAYKDSDNFAAAGALLNDLMGRSVPRMVDSYLGRNLHGPEYTVYSPWNHDDS